MTVADGRQFLPELASPHPRDADLHARRAQANPERRGTAPGINIAPGSDDDGWIVPEPIQLADGTRIQLYKDGEALHAAFEAIKSARHRICLEVYIFASDDTGRAFTDLLCAKAREGVRVYVIYDSFGSIDTDRSIFRRMRQAGVNLQQFHPIRPWECRYGWRPFNRDHRKLLVIDDHIGGLGGLNVGAQYAGSWIVQDQGGDDSCCDFWRDNAIGMVGPSVKLLLRSFANTWRYVQSGGRIRKAELVHNIELADRTARLRAYRRRQARRIRRFRLRLSRFRLRHHAPEGGDGQTVAPAAPAATTPADGVRLELPHHRASPLSADFGLIASVPTASSPLGSMFRKLFRGAERSIQLTMAYFAPSDVFIGELCRAARRGVKVQVMLPAECDVHLLMVAARSFYDTLMSAGVQIYERQGAVLHAKTMVIDGETTIIGSTNLDYRSIEYNCELSAIIRSREFGRQMQDLFANDVCYAKPILPGEWRRRPVRDRVVQWAVQRARYLL